MAKVVSWAKIAMTIVASTVSGCVSAPTSPRIDAASPPLAEEPVAAPSAPPVAAAEPQFDLRLCPIAVVNAPAADKDGRILGATRQVALNGVRLLLAPVSDGCLSSGYGVRAGRNHNGVDYYSTDGVALAAAAGVVLEKASRADYGNMVVIDHGRGVFTRYAHLASFDRGFDLGDTVGAGDPIGPIGQSGAAGAPHLHYEILTGDYRLPAGAFGLSAVDPFSLIERNPTTKTALR